MFKFLAGMIFLAALAAFFTKPDSDAAEVELKNQLLSALAEQKLEGKSGAETATLLACRLDPNTCYELVRSGVEMQYEDRTLYARLDLEGFGHAAACYGLYTRFVCPGGLQKQ